MGKTVFESIKDSKFQSHKLELIGFIEQLRSQAAPHLVKSQAPSSCVQGGKLLLWAETRKGVVERVWKLLEKKGLFLGRQGLPSAPLGTERACVIDDLLGTCQKHPGSVPWAATPWPHCGPVLFSLQVSGLDFQTVGWRPVWEKSTADSNCWGEQVSGSGLKSCPCRLVSWGWRAPGLPLGQKTDADHVRALPPGGGGPPGGRRTGARHSREHSRGLCPLQP